MTIKARYLLAAIAIAVASIVDTCNGGVEDAVVKVSHRTAEGIYRCSGVAVAPDLVVTCEHFGATHRATVTTRDGRAYRATVVYQPPKNHADEVIALRVDGANLEYVAIGEKPSLPASVVGYGYPDGVWMRYDGRAIPNTFAPRTDGLPHVVCDFETQKGQSGGGLFNEDGELIGLASLSTTKEDDADFSFWIPVACIHTAVEQAAKQPQLVMIGADWCPPCRTAKTDHANGKFFGYRFTYVDYTTESGRAYHDKIVELSKKHKWPVRYTSKDASEVSLPKFVIVGQSGMQVGYDGPRSLLDWVAGLFKLIGKTVTDAGNAVFGWGGFQEQDFAQAGAVPPPPPVESPSVVPESVAETKADVAALKAELAEAKQHLREIIDPDNGKITKLVNALKLKSDVAEIIALKDELREDITTVRTDAQKLLTKASEAADKAKEQVETIRSEESSKWDKAVAAYNLAKQAKENQDGVPWWYGLAGVLLGIGEVHLKRRGLA